MEESPKQPDEAIAAEIEACGGAFRITNVAIENIAHKFGISPARVLRVVLRLRRQVPPDQRPGWKESRL